jgi:hypothetical protein
LIKRIAPPLIATCLAIAFLMMILALRDGGCFR